MNRTELKDAIFELCEDPHMYAYALEAAFAHLSVDELGKVFDQVADHHELRTKGTSRLRLSAAAEDEARVANLDVPPRP